MLKEHELRVYVLRDPRTGKKLYFTKGANARRVEEECMMVYEGTELFHTGHPMPHIEDWRPKLDGPAE